MLVLYAHNSGFDDVAGSFPLSSESAFTFEQVAKGAQIPGVSRCPGISRGRFDGQAARALGRHSEIAFWTASTGNA